MSDEVSVRVSKAFIGVVLEFAEKERDALRVQMQHLRDKERQWDALIAEWTDVLNCEDDHA
jgi:hypothetical protein